MQMLEHYFELYRAWKPEQNGTGGEAAVTIPAIAGTLHCTERNAKLLIRSMRDRGWIAWRPGRGRGHSSRLRFLADPDGLLLQRAESLLAAGHIQEAAAMLSSPLLSEQGREAVRYAIARSFGYRQQPAKPQQRHLLRFPTYRLPGSLDPAYATRRTELHWICQLFDTLVVYDAGRESYAPGIAHHWEADRTGCRWRFYLQKHVRFHDGAPCTAAEVKASLERLAKPHPQMAPSPYTGLYAQIESIEAVHEHLVEIRCRRPCRHMLALLALPCASIVPVQRPAGWPLQPVGTGPFSLTRFEERVLTLEANPGYFTRGSHLDRVEMWCLPQLYEGARANEHETEGMNFIHYDYGTAGSVTKRAATESLWKRVERMDSGCKYVLVQQAADSPLRCCELRNRVHDIIRQGNVQLDLGGNRGELADRFVRSMERWGDGASSAPVESGMAAGAAEEQAQLAVPALRLVTYPGAGNERDAEWLRRIFAERGIVLDVRLAPYEELASQAVLAEADLLLLEQPVHADEEAAMWALLGSEQSPLRQCLPKASLRKLDDGLAELGEQADRAARLQAFSLLEQELLADRAVVLWYRWRQSASFPLELQGVRISAYGWVDYKELWYRDGESDGEWDQDRSCGQEE